ncbi:MAG TPA: TIGR04282 family arsenosugar biosynthesis glycosyltransferase [Gemmataceae bacterium]|nr:TIGR04282 family arsenosugar biosynthesis glycosyltransferase [Gemmataceae bacterium]
MTTRVLGLFAKWPEPGRVKTRLAAGTSSAWAADVALAFLRDLVRRLGVVGDRRVLAFAPPDARPLFADAVGGSFALVPQQDGDLGRRLSSFFNDQFAAGAGSVVVLGTDSPTLPLTFVDQAFTALAEADMVLGPATDGGYYLVGCRRGVPPIFDGISWGGSTVLAETVARLANPASRLALLPPWYDVDTLDDWRMLCGHLAALRRAGLDPGVPDTEALCQASQP